MLKEGTTASLEMGIAHCDKMSRRTPAWLRKMKAGFWLARLTMQTVLLHGEYCVVKKDGEPIAGGRLSFGEFDCFFVDKGDEELRFSLSDKHILSGKQCIEKVGEGLGISSMSLGTLVRPIRFCLSRSGLPTIRSLVIYWR